MSLKHRYADLITESQVRRQGLWESLALLDAEEWTNAPISDRSTPNKLLAECIAGDWRLIAAVEAAAVGLAEPPAAEPVSPPISTPEALLDQAVAVAKQLDAPLASLDNRQWQRKIRYGGRTATIAEAVDAANSAHSRSQAALDRYLGSFERLGEAGLQQWLRAVYDELMDSIAGMSEEEIIGEAWYGQWNTYDLLVHAWSWNDVALQAAKRWHESDPPVEIRQFPDIDTYNEHLRQHYGDRNIIMVADGIVTTFRRSMQFVERAEAGLLQKENMAPWSFRNTRSSLCAMIYDVNRHAWEHAQEIRAYRRGLNEVED